MARLVIALGGNALGNSVTEQKQRVQLAAKIIVDLAQKNQVVVCHGNGPQVGMINNVFIAAVKEHIIAEELPFPECGAMSQGYIGFHLQNAINKVLKQQKREEKVVTLVTQTVVAKDDPAFKNPSKPIGNFLTKAAAQQLQKETGYSFIEDAGRGWRRVVPSPKPIHFPELKVIKTLLAHNCIVIAAGGGGIPVYQDKDTLVGVAAVIDKDASSAKLAEMIVADQLIILTAVDFVKINFNKSNETSLTRVSTKELKQYIQEKQFYEGSMLPKVVACIDFVEQTRQKAFIGNLKNGIKILSGQGTEIFCLRKENK